MNLRVLGLTAMIFAPFLFIDFLSLNPATGMGTSLDGLYSLLYISGWMCSIVGLWKEKATGENRWGRLVLLIQLLFLALANLSNIMLVLQIGSGGRVYFILDLFWPISNVWMLATGITVVAAKKIRGPFRYIPLIVGFWFPFCMLISMVLGKMSATAMYLGGAYSAVAWALLGLFVYKSATRQTFSNPHMA